MQRPDLSIALRLPSGYHLARSLGHVGMGPADPTLVVRDGEACWGIQGPTGPLALSVEHKADKLHVAVWGHDADWLEPQLGAMFGLEDEPASFHPRQPDLRELLRRSTGLHLLRLPTLFTRLMQVVMLQLITYHDATQAWRKIVRFTDVRAPAIPRLFCPPSADDFARIPLDRYVGFGLPHQQSRTLTRLARQHARINALQGLPAAEADAGLKQLDGVGPWTSQYLLGTAAGHADAALVGDFHLPDTIAWLLAREPRAGDERMLELLEPFSGDRFRVVRAIWVCGLHAPRRGPKITRRIRYQD